MRTIAKQLNANKAQHGNYMSVEEKIAGEPLESGDLVVENKGVVKKAKEVKPVAAKKKAVTKKKATKKMPC